MNPRSVSKFLPVATLLLSTLSGQATPSQTDPAKQPRLTPAEVETLGYLRTLRDPKAAGPQAVGEEIHALGSGTLECLLMTLEERRVLDPLDLEGDGQILSEVQLEAVLCALTAFGRDSVMPSWEEYFKDSVEPVSVTAAMQSLGAFGHARDLDRLWELAPREDEVELPKMVRRGMQTATTAILKRDPRAFPRLEATWSGLPDEWRSEIVRAVGQAGDGRGVGLLTEMYLWTSDQQRLISSQLPLIGPSNDPEENRALADALLTQLRSESKEDVQAALLGVAMLEDFTPVPELIELLSDERSGVSRNAHHALIQLTNKSLSANPKLWERWYDEEKRWFRSERTALVGRLRNRDPHVVVAALREISRHRLNRHELALDVCDSLSSDSPEVRAMAAAVLSELGSRWGVLDLAYALIDESEAVRTATHAALVVITGEDFGVYTEGWTGEGFPERPY